MLLDPCVKRAEKYSKSTILQTMFDQTGYPWGNTPELWKSYVSSSLSASVSFPFQLNVMPGATRGFCCACSCCESRRSSRRGPATPNVELVETCRNHDCYCFRLRLFIVFDSDKFVVCRWPRHAGDTQWCITVLNYKGAFRSFFLPAWCCGFCYWCTILVGG